MKIKNCIVPNCTTNSERNPNSTFHYLPANEKTLQQWIKNMKMENLLETPRSTHKHYVVCDKHFEDKCFQTYEKKKLNRGAVPTIFLHEDSLKVSFNTNPLRNTESEINSLKSILPISSAICSNKVKHCAVPNCSNNSDKNSLISFHYLPSKAELREKWFTKMNMNHMRKISLTTQAHYVICGEHFTDSCYQTSERKKLNRGAIPTILNASGLS